MNLAELCPELNPNQLKMIKRELLERLPKSRQTVDDLDVGYDYALMEIRQVIKDFIGVTE